MSDKIYLGSILASNGKYYVPEIVGSIENVMNVTLGTVNLNSGNGWLTTDKLIINPITLGSTGTLVNGVDKVYPSTNPSYLIRRYFSSKPAGDETVYNNAILLINPSPVSTIATIGSVSSTSIYTYTGFNVSGGYVFHKEHASFTKCLVHSAFDLSKIREITVEDYERQFISDGEFLYSSNQSPIGGGGSAIFKRNLVSGEEVARVHLTGSTVSVIGLLQDDVFLYLLEYSNKLIRKIRKTTLEVVGTVSYINGASRTFSIHEGHIYLPSDSNLGIKKINTTTLTEVYSTLPISGSLAVSDINVGELGIHVGLTSNQLFKLKEVNTIVNYKEV